MTSFRLLAALLCALLFSSCQVANTLLQAPGNLLGAVTHGLHVSNDRAPGDAGIGAVEARQAQDQLAMQESVVKDTGAVAASEVAVR